MKASRYGQNLWRLIFPAAIILLSVLLLGHYTEASALDNTQQAAPLITASATGTATSTPSPSAIVPTGTPTSASTAMPTATHTAPVPTSYCCNDGSIAATGTASCSVPGVYDYNFDTVNDCIRQLSPSFTAYFEAAATQNGTWDVLDQHGLGGYIPMEPGQHVAFTDTFNIPSMPSQYNWYRIRLYITWDRCMGQTGSTTAYTAPAVPCREELTSTVTTTAGAIVSNTSTATATGTSLTPTDTMTPSATSTPACQPWAEVAQYPTTDFSLMATSLGGDVYGFGGRDASYTRLTSAYRYDPGTDSWTQLASMPQICFWCSAVTVNGQIWIVNGSHDQGGSKNSSIYDPLQNSWRAGINGLEATYGQSVVYMNGVIYRIGGLGDSGYSNTIEDYGHTLLAPMPQGVAWAQAAAIGGYIYVAGGSTAGGLTNKTYRYDPATNSWDDTAMADLPEARGWAGSGVVDGRWVIVGGVGTEGSALEWDPQTNSWSSIAPPIYPRSDMGAAVAGGKLYLVGGLAATQNEVTAKTQRYDPSACMTPTATATLTATNTPTPTTTATTAAATTASPTPSPTRCPLQFTDVPQGSNFYPYIRCLACLGIVSGYADGTFKPNNNVTRGQIAKIISNAAGFNDPQQTQIFKDVPPGSTFFDFIGRLASRSFMQGYPCGGQGEPCVPPANLPYFRPNNNATRGQIAKIDTNAAGINDTPSGQVFEDVPVGSAYYTVTYRAAAHATMSGYQCGGQGEPCVPPANLPYFRPNNNATRGQSSKVVSLTFFPECNPRD